MCYMEQGGKIVTKPLIHSKKQTGEVVGFFREKMNDQQLKGSRTFDVEKTIVGWRADKQNCALASCWLQCKGNLITLSPIWQEEPAARLERRANLRKQGVGRGICWIG